jgi:hypothetical protein
MLRKLILKSTLLGLVLLPAGVLNADVTYYYTGNDFNKFINNPDLTASNNLTITLTFASALADNLNYVDESGSVTTWSVSDGIRTIASGGAGILTNLDLSTDASGMIAADWYVNVDIPTQAQMQSADVANSAVVDFSLYLVGDTSYGAHINNDPGVWSNTPGEPVPEPGFVGLVSAGLAGLALVWRQRRRRA